MSLAVNCAAIVISLAASVWLLIFLPRHARSKGYGSPLIGVGLWSGWLITALACTLWVFLKSTFRSSWSLLAVPELALVLVAGRNDLAAACEERTARRDRAASNSLIAPWACS